MKRHELIRHLREHECRMDVEGANHTKFVNPTTGQKATVPRHTEIDNRLAVRICKQLGIKPIR